MRIVHSRVAILLDAIKNLNTRFYIFTAVSVSSRGLLGCDTV